MTFVAGARIGPYEIVGSLGAGGMGEVYRATDTNLKRQVAIKVLPESVTGDADRLTRFQREAEVLAQLNHPHIAAIYGLERSSGVPALVMELVEGPTLADRIAQGALPIDEALPIAKQIAEALEAAHEQGIVHRDLKPANIKVRPDGTVKVLDFGLAKAMAPPSAAATAGHALSQSPTLSLAATQQGVILGTAAYMSPEQARGRTVDRRTDLWAFGCVLYEMLTGRQVFAPVSRAASAADEGTTVADTLASVLTKELDWSLLPAATPTQMRRLLRRCLERERKRRLDSAAAARLEIEEAIAAPHVSVAGKAPRFTGRARLAWAMFAVASLAAVALSVPAARHLKEAAPGPLPETRADIVTPATTDDTSMALSPDGQSIVFVASGDGVPRLWLRRLSEATAQPLAETEGALQPFWARDSSAIGYFANGQLKRLALAGGSPQAVVASAQPRGGTWNADGTILFTPATATPLWRVAAAGGQAVVATTLQPGQTSHRFPVFMPDGRHFVFWAQGTVGARGLYLGSLGDAEMTRLTDADGAGAFLESGWLLWVRAGALMAQRLDVERRMLEGDPVVLAEGIAVDTVNGAVALSASPSGLLAYRRGGRRKRQLIWFNRNGKAVGTMGEPDDNDLMAPTLSPDGRRVAFYRSILGNTDIWLSDGTRTTRLTFDPALDRYPIWSPDGRKIVFDSTRSGRDLYIKDADGSGTDVLLANPPGDNKADDWSADGRFVTFRNIDPSSATGRDIWVLPMNTADRKPQIFLKTQFEEREPSVSPDGRWLAHTSNSSGRTDVYIRPFDAVENPQRSGTGAREGGAQWQVSTAGGVYPRWSRDGRELYYLAPNADLMAVPIVVRGATVEPGTPVALFQTRVFGGGQESQQGRQYDASRDGRFLVNTVLDDAMALPITLIQNWHPPATTR